MNNAKVASILLVSVKVIDNINGSWFIQRPPDHPTVLSILSSTSIPLVVSEY